MPEQGVLTRSLESVGRPVMAALEFIGELALLCWDTLRRLLLPPYEWREVLNQMSFIGASSVPIVALTTLSSGAVIALYISDILVRYGAATLAGATVGMAVVREIAPVLAGIMVASRCGSAIAAQIGTMAVTEQIDALKSLNVSPTSYLIVPRLLAAVTMLPVLGLVGMFAGIAGGYFVAVNMAHVPGPVFLDSIRQWMKVEDVQKGLIKTVVFGVAIVMVACQQGLATQEGAVGVGRSTTRTVVITMVLVYVLDYFLSTWLFALGR